MASVRPATAADAELLARLQLEMFTVHPAYVQQLPDGVRQTPAAERAAAWEQRLAAGGPVWIASEGGHPVGLAAVTEPDPTEVGPGEIELLLVLPRWTRRGHGGRLLATAGDWLRRSGAIRGSIWALAGDESAARFLAGVDWPPDGRTRGFDTGERVLTELRHTGSLDLLLV